MALVRLTWGEVGTGIYSDDYAKDGLRVLLDATLRETSTRSKTVTSYPVEEGADISDHVKDEPHELRIDGIITNTPASLEETLVSSPTRAEDAYEKLLQLVERKRPVLVATSKRKYEDMVLTGVSRIRSASVGDAVQVSITARQIRTVQSQTVAAPVRKKRSPKRNLGKRPKTPVSGKKATLLKRGLDAAIGAVKGAP